MHHLMHKHVLLIQTHIIPEPLEMIILHSDTGTYSRRSRLNGYLKEIVAEENVAGAPGAISLYARPFCMRDMDQASDVCTG